MKGVDLNILAIILLDIFRDMWYLSQLRTVLNYHYKAWVQLSKGKNKEKAWR